MLRSGPVEPNGSSASGPVPNMGLADPDGTNPFQARNALTELALGLVRFRWGRPGSRSDPRGFCWRGLNSGPTRKGRSFAPCLEPNPPHLRRFPAIWPGNAASTADSRNGPPLARDGGGAAVVPAAARLGRDGDTTVSTPVPILRLSSHLLIDTLTVAYMRLFPVNHFSLLSIE
ncbi:hypothetical protein EJB05_50534, partial [Eragrostis curvula]